MYSCETELAAATKLQYSPRSRSMLASALRFLPIVSMRMCVVSSVYRD